MSNLPYSSAVLHNDDNDDRNNASNAKVSPINSRITSRSILKRQQYIETRIANNQACDEIHDLQPKSSSLKKFVHILYLSTKSDENLILERQVIIIPPPMKIRHIPKHRKQTVPMN